MKRMLAVAMAITATVLLVGIKESTAGNRGTLTISANVLPTLSQTTVRQPSVLRVTKQDISKGFIDIETGTMLQVTSNDPNGYFLNFYIDGQLIKQADVMINGRPVSVQLGAGLVHQASPGIGGETIQITYRLFLSSEMIPGSYQWPVTVAASLM